MDNLYQKLIQAISQVQNNIGNLKMPPIQQLANVPIQAANTMGQGVSNVKDFVTQPKFISPTPDVPDIPNDLMQLIQTIQMREQLRNLMQSLYAAPRQDYRGPRLMNPEETTPWQQAPRNGFEYNQDLEKFINSPGYQQILKR